MVRTSTPPAAPWSSSTAAARHADRAQRRPRLRPDDGGRGLVHRLRRTGHADRRRDRARRPPRVRARGGQDRDAAPRLQQPGLREHRGHGRARLPGSDRDPLLRPRQGPADVLDDHAADARLARRDRPRGRERHLRRAAGPERLVTCQRSRRPTRASRDVRRRRVDPGQRRRRAGARARGIDADKDGFFAGQDCNDDNAGDPARARRRSRATDRRELRRRRPSRSRRSPVGRGARLGVQEAQSYFTLKSLRVTQQFPKGWKVEDQAARARSARSSPRR